MAFFSKQAAEPVPEVETAIWNCKNEDCSGWMRAKFSFSKHPVCPLCDSEMAEEIKVLPKITLF